MPVLTMRGSLRDDTKKELDRFKQQCVGATKDAARMLTQAMMDRTPVWTGKTAGSFVWGFNGVGTDSGFAGGPPEPTSHLDLGSEANRAEAEAYSMNQLEGVLGGVTELGTLVVTNVSDIWDMVDNGSAPTPDRARNPGGVSVMAEQTVVATMEGTFK